MTEWHPLRSLESDDSEFAKMWKKLDKSAEQVAKTIAATAPATMPTLDHSSMADYYNVYEPSDDTYLLIDAIKHDLFAEYPSDGIIREDGQIILDASGTEKEEEIINRTALNCYYDHVRLRSESSQEAAEDEGDQQIVQELVETKGYSEEQSKRVLYRLQQLKRLDEILTVMEIGTGSGVPITYLSKWLLAEKPKHENGNKFSMIATDLNPLALEFCRKTAHENGVVLSEETSATLKSIDFVECDLATPLLEDKEGTIDVLLFNPPYVPTEDSEVSGNGIEISWAGGTDGRLVVDRALPQIARLLRKPSGVCYMITVDDNRPCEMATILKQNYGLHMVPLARRRARNEYLSVQKISWLTTTPK